MLTVGGSVLPVTGRHRSTAQAASGVACRITRQILFAFALRINLPVSPAPTKLARRRNHNAALHPGNKVPPDGEQCSGALWVSGDHHGNVRQLPDQGVGFPPVSGVYTCTGANHRRWSHLRFSFRCCALPAFVPAAAKYKSPFALAIKPLGEFGTAANGRVAGSDPHHAKSCSSVKCQSELGNFWIQKKK